MKAIAQDLNQRRIPFPAKDTRRGPARLGWAVSTVRVILRNEKYAGVWVWNKTRFLKDPDPVDAGRSGGHRTSGFDRNGPSCASLIPTSGLPCSDGASFRGSRAPSTGCVWARRPRDDAVGATPGAPDVDAGQARAPRRAPEARAGPAQAKAEIAKHLDGDLTVRPLPATGRERHAEIRGRAKLNSLLE
jgi:hypothetical protein